MSDDEHPELEFDPLEDTKVWPEEVFEPGLVGTMTLNSNVTDQHNENEQIAIGTGVLVDGLREATGPGHQEVGAELSGRPTRSDLPRTNDYLRAGERFRLMEDWERDELVANLVANIGEATREVQERMVWHFFMCEDELGQRAGDGLGTTADDLRHLEPLPRQKLTEEEQARLANLGKSGPREVEGHTMTHCVPNERVVVDR